MQVGCCFSLIQNNSTLAPFPGSLICVSLLPSQLKEHPQLPPSPHYLPPPCFTGPAPAEPFAHPWLWRQALGGVTSIVRALSKVLLQYLSSLKKNSHSDGKLLRQR